MEYSEMHIPMLSINSLRHYIQATLLLTDHQYTFGKNHWKMLRKNLYFCQNEDFFQNGKIVFLILRKIQIFFQHFGNNTDFFSTFWE